MSVQNNLFEILLINEIHTVDADDAVFVFQLAYFFLFFFPGKDLICFEFRSLTTAHLFCYSLIHIHFFRLRFSNITELNLL